MAGRVFPQRPSIFRRCRPRAGGRGSSANYNDSMQSPPARSRLSWPLVLLAVLSILGAVLRLWQARESLWVDELHTAWCALGDWSQVAPRARIGNQSPLFFWLQWLLVRGLGASEITMRLPSLVAGSLLPAAVFVPRPVLDGLILAGSGRRGAGGGRSAVDLLRHRSPAVCPRAVAGRGPRGRRFRAGRTADGLAAGGVCPGCGAAVSLALYGGVGARRGASTAAAVVHAARSALSAATPCPGPGDDRSALPAGGAAPGIRIRPPRKLGVVRAASASRQALRRASLVGRRGIRRRSAHPLAIFPAVAPTATIVSNCTDAVRCWLLAWLLVPLALTWLTTATDLARLFFHRYLIASAPAAAILAAATAALAPSRWGRAVVATAMAAAAGWSLLARLPDDGRIIRARGEDWRTAVAWLNEQLAEHPDPVLLRSGFIESRGLRQPHAPLLEDYCLLPLTSLYVVRAERADLVPLPSQEPWRIDDALAERLNDRGGAWLVVRTGRRSGADIAAEQLARRLERRGGRQEGGRSTVDRGREEAAVAGPVAWRVERARSFGGVHVFSIRREAVPPSP
jgi:mannosyltransferase